MWCCNVFLMFLVNKMVPDWRSNLLCYTHFTCVMTTFHMVNLRKAWTFAYQLILIMHVCYTPSHGSHSISITVSYWCFSIVVLANFSLFFCTTQLSVYIWCSRFRFTAIDTFINPTCYPTPFTAKGPRIHTKCAVTDTVTHSAVDKEIVISGSKI